MKEEITNKIQRGRKFWALQEILALCIIYILACMYKESLSDVSNVVMTAIGAGAAYMGANAWKAVKK